MEATLKPSQCPLHPNDTIQRVSLAANANFPLFCIECILSPQVQSLQLPMITLKSFLDKVSEHYKTHGTPQPLESTMPDDLPSVLNSQQEAIAEFSQYIENQKAQVIQTANQTFELIKQSLDQKRDELLHHLDLQLILFKANFKYYEAKINTFYDKTNDTPLSQETLIQKINGFEEIEQFLAFFQQVKDDMSEAQNNKRQRDSHINSRLRELSLDLRTQADLFSKDPLTLVKDHEEIMNEVKSKILPVISECFTQGKAPIELLSYTNSSGLRIEELVANLAKKDAKMISSIFKYMNSAPENSNLSKFFLEREKSLLELINSISNNSLSSSIRDEALLILCGMLEVKTLVAVINKHPTIIIKELVSSLESKNEIILLAILKVFKGIFEDIYVVKSVPGQDAYSLFSMNRGESAILRLRNSEYSSVRDLRKQVIDLIGDEFELEENERYYQEEKDYYKNFERKKPAAQRYYLEKKDEYSDEYDEDYPEESETYGKIAKAKRPDDDFIDEELPVKAIKSKSQPQAQLPSQISPEILNALLLLTKPK